MKTLLLLSAFSLAARSYASDDDLVLQYLRWGADMTLSQQSFFYGFYGQKAEEIKTNRVATIATYSIGKNDHKKWLLKRSYNENGRITHFENRQAIYDFILEGDKVVEVIKTTKRAVLHTKITYDNENRIVQMDQFRNEKPFVSFSYTYFEGKKTSLVEHREHTGKKRLFRYETMYDDLLKKPTESAYYINGKLKQKWTYSCDEKGKPESLKQVEETTQCSYTSENNDGSYVIYLRVLKDDGEIYLSETTYDADSTFREYKHFFRDTILVSHQLKTGNLTTYEEFHKKSGRRVYKYCIETDEHGNQVASRNYNRKEKETNSSFSAYDSNNLLLERTYSNSRNKEVFEYSFYEN